MSTAPEDESRAKGGPAAAAAEEKDGQRADRKLTVLESHGYALGRTIGAGSYATVKVRHFSLTHTRRKKIVHAMYGTGNFSANNMNSNVAVL